MAATGGRAHDVRMILEAERDGAARPPKRDFQRYYALKRGELDAAGKAVADLLALLPHNVSVAAERLAVAAAVMKVPDTTPSLDHLRRLRLLKEDASGMALGHSIAQDFFRAGLSEARRITAAKAWYKAFEADDPRKLTAGAAVAMLPVIGSNLLEKKSDEEISGDRDFGLLRWVRSRSASSSWIALGDLDSARERSRHCSTPYSPPKPGFNSAGIRKSTSR